MEEKRVVLPGEKVAAADEHLPGKNVFKDEDNLYAKKIGLVSLTNNVLSVIPLNGVYIPKVGDMVIGEVKSVQSNGWVLTIGAPHDAYLPLSGVKEFIDTTRTDLNHVYGVGDAVYGKIHAINQFDSIHISMQDTRARKFKDGLIVKISPAKVPRVIGKEGSMINLIKEKTGCRISVGQNGFIWVAGDNEHKAEEAIRMVEQEAAGSGLTNKVAAFLG